MSSDVVRCWLWKFVAGVNLVLLLVLMSIAVLPAGAWADEGEGENVRGQWIHEPVEALDTAIEDGTVSRGRSPFAMEQINAVEGGSQEAGMLSEAQSNNVSAVQAKNAGNANALKADEASSQLDGLSYGNADENFDLVALHSADSSSTQASVDNDADDSVPIKTNGVLQDAVNVGSVKDKPKPRNCQSAPSVNNAKSAQIKRTSDGKSSEGGDKPEVGGKSPKLHEGAANSSLATTRTAETGKSPNTVVTVESSKSSKSIKASKASKAAKAAKSTKATKDPDEPGVAYQVKQGTSSWDVRVENGKIAGSPSSSAPLEGCKVKIVDSNAKGSIQYQMYIDGIGWTRVKTDGIAAGRRFAGTTATAIRVALVGNLSKHYSVRYRANLSDKGWTDWIRDGRTAGVVDSSQFMTALRVKLVKREKASLPGNGLVGVFSAACIQGKGWKGARGDGIARGSLRGLSVSAFKAQVDTGAAKGGITYIARRAGEWDKSWSTDGSVAGSSDGSDAISAMKVRLTGNFAKSYDVLYRTYVVGSGWQAWTFNGRTAGGSADDQIGAFWMKLVRKGSSKAISEGAYYIRCASSKGIALDNPGGSVKLGTQMQGYELNRSVFQKFYLWDEGDGVVSLQSMASGLFLADAAGKVLQLTDKVSDSRRWKVTWDAGYVLSNVRSGKVLGLKGGSAKQCAPAIVSSFAGADAQRWLFSSADLLASGYYHIKSALGTRLDVAGASYAYGANVQSFSPNSSGAQVFHVYKRPGGYYLIVNAQSFLAVEVKDASVDDYANVRQWEAHGAFNQQWKPSYDRSGYLILTNRNSGKVLEIRGSSALAGANVRQRAFSKAALGQRWKFVECERYSLSGDNRLDRYVADILRDNGSLHEAYNWTVGHSYRAGERYWSNPRVLPDSTTVDLAKDFIENDSGNCYRFAAAFCWLARGLGYSANTISGWVEATGGGQAPHGWTEVYLDGKTYVCDADMNEALPQYNWYLQTYESAPIAYHSW